jgi:hypothetical protein
MIARIFVNKTLAGSCEIKDSLFDGSGSRRAPAANDTIDVVLHDEHPQPDARPLFATARAEEMR